MTSTGGINRGIRNDYAHSRLVLETDGLAAELIYLERPGELVIVHTEVPEELGGHGTGGQLVQAAVELAKDMGLRVAPWCPFARHWLRTHPEVSSSSDVDWSTPEAP
jgi:uncharacterized protein